MPFRKGQVIREPMPKLIIDGRNIEVPEGTKVIEAAERLGIMIPRFCYHKALGAVGACRVCAVKFVDGPVKGIEMSCMEDARDGMVVSTTDPEAQAFRKYVIEWLMLNHPLDCPVCDEGGHCLLQDQTVAGGHGLRRYQGKKRTYHDQTLGPFVQHEMNRCIHCFRCRRFYQDFAGYRDLGAMQIGNRMYFGRFEDGTLESPFSGNLIDICPTGVYTDKPARFKGRRWDFERSPSLCIHCSLGCSTTVSARYREVMRQEARYNESVNGFFICDRGRYGFDFANHRDRLRTARIGDKAVPWKEGIEAAASELKKITGQAGAWSVACLGSSRCSLETQASLKRLCRQLGWPDPFYFTDPLMARKVRSAVDNLDGQLAVSMREIEGADFILAVGADPLNEAPMAALAMRQAHRKGAHVAVVDPRPVSLPFTFSHFAVTREALDLCTGRIVRAALNWRLPKDLAGESAGFFDALLGHDTPDPDLEIRLDQTAEKLAKSQRPVLICGTDIVPEHTPSLVATLAHLLRRSFESTGLFYLLPGPNGFGAGLLSSGQEEGSVVEAMESGKIKALILVEQDLFHRYPDRKRLEKALEGLDFLLVLDYLPSPSAIRAHIVLPTTTVFESASTFVNQEGRVHTALPVHRGGTPISQVDGGKHPPRTFLDHVPGGDPKAAHVTLDELYAAIAGKEKGRLVGDIFDWLAQEDPVFEPIRSVSQKLSGFRFSLQTRGTPDFSIPIRGGRSSGQEGFELLLTERIFGTEELSRYSVFTQQAETAPAAFLHPEDAQRLGLSEGDRLSISLEGGELVVGLCMVPTMAKGIVIIPRHRQLDWQKTSRWPVRLKDEQIRKHPA
jgi:NADH-quinone oxidoreductase subunit G